RDEELDHEQGDEQHLRLTREVPEEAKQTRGRLRMLRNRSRLQVALKRREHESAAIPSGQYRLVGTSLNAPAQPAESALPNCQSPARARRGGPYAHPGCAR